MSTKIEWAESYRLISHKISEIGHSAKNYSGFDRYESVHKNSFSRFYENINRHPQYEKIETNPC